MSNYKSKSMVAGVYDRTAVNPFCVKVLIPALAVRCQAERPGKLN